MIKNASAETEGDRLASIFTNHQNGQNIFRSDVLSEMQKMN